MLHALADLLYPPRCLVCRLPGSDPLCGGCRRTFTPVPPPLCRVCGGPLRAEAVRARSPRPAGETCRRCRAAPVPFAAARSMALFEGRLRTAIHRLKFEGRQELGALLGQMLAGFVRATPALGGPGVIIPVPLHPSRLKERGYNHATLIAEPVAATVRAPLADAVLLRVTATGPQTALGRDDRLRNVRGAFDVPPAMAHRVRGRSVLLIDDVLTSGATAVECARALLRAGAGAVRVATLARAEDV